MPFDKRCGHAPAVVLFLITTSTMGSVAFRADAAPSSSWRAEGPLKLSIIEDRIRGEKTADATAWIVNNDRFESFGLQFRYHCIGCSVGVLLGYSSGSGTYVSFQEPAFFTIKMDVNRREMSRERISAAKDEVSQNLAVAMSDLKSTSLSGQTPHPFSNPLALPKVNQTGWNHVEIRTVPAGVQAFLNGVAIGPQFGAKHTGIQSGFGEVGIRIESKRGSEVVFEGLSLSDFSKVEMPRPRVSDHFRIQQLTGFHYGFGEAVADLDNDGIVDVLAGPIYFRGPDFKQAIEIDEARPLDPSGYTMDAPLGVLTADFTGDGWVDVLMTGWPAGKPAYLYVNPQHEKRHWRRFRVIDSVMGEIFALDDIDGDGKPNFIYAADGYVNSAEPDPGNPTEPWDIHHLTEKGPWGKGHGLGVGDINGDGRKDVLTAWGWWEQPSMMNTMLWKFHPTEFGRVTLTTPGGAQMHVYDVDGDGWNDVITSLEGHGYGLAWFQQRRDSHGRISFDRRMIMDLDPALSHGVVFSELHSVALVDIDGDGLKDIVTGKSKYNLANYNQYYYPDSDGDPVLYYFKLNRIEGKVDFIPHFIQNLSGSGRQIQIHDLNEDGRPDIFTNTRYGAFISYNMVK